ncbi:glycosyltransferase family 4 protein [Gordonia sp. 852002-51296_SCH5728562-b]|uniref:glycosyltransferase family 4 protein n=1 Tax=Gordonia sp. 852002-51296_SCH5728562-b TaxID=1834101 RepID=UPI0007E99433|nr:glycosyltransferase family 4 protein [Gordonia sp. 852002-51296_SCH5728562-b]OBA30858.1 hypothetical protein A5766_15060 [Gordonia sp. 852002-51296_SCH5728562-b]
MTGTQTQPGIHTHNSSLDGLSVCVVACHFAPETTGSAPYNTLLVDTLSQAGARVELITGVPHYPQWRVDDPRYRRGILWRETRGEAGEISVRRLRHSVPSTVGIGGRFRLESSFAALSAPFVAASSADIVIAVSPLLGAAAAVRVGKRGRPAGVFVHDLVGNAAAQSGTVGRASQLISRAEYNTYRTMDRVGVCTPRFRSALTNGGIDDAAIMDLPVFTHVSRSSESSTEARAALDWDFPDDAIVVVHTGNIGRKQGLTHVVDAAREISRMPGAPIEFVLVGDGNERAGLREQARGVSNIRFVDPVDAESYPRVLAAADVLLLHELPGVVEMSLPSKLTSYVTAGRPVVAAVEDSGIAGRLLESYEAASIISAGDPTALAAAVRQAVDDEAVRGRLLAGAARLGDAEFGTESGKRAFCTFASEIANS